MRRYHVKQGDKTTAGGVVLEGIANTFHHDTLLSFVGAKIYCHGCKSQGVLAPEGPRFPDDFMGHKPALNNDICICRCDPPPRLLASQGTMYEEYGPAELAAMGFSDDGKPLQKIVSSTNCAQRILVKDSVTGEPLTQQPYLLDIDGVRQMGRTDANGYALIKTNGAKPFILHVVFSSPKRELEPNQRT